MLAERPRENLILDSGVRLRATEPLEVRVVLRAQRSDFPGSDDAALFERARRLCRALPAGYGEVEAAAVRLPDPGFPERTLDTSFEVTFAKRVPTLSDAFAELRDALRVEKDAASAAPDGA